MKLGVLSDSHGNLKNLEEAAKWLIENEKVDVLVHLGDDSDDTKVLEKFGVKLIKVPGVFEDYYQDPGITNRLIETFDEKKVLISHTEEIHKNDPSPEVKELIRPEEVIAKKEVDIALAGHTHIPKIEGPSKAGYPEGVLIFNPGHLKEWETEQKKGYFPSFGLVDFEKRIAKVINLEKKVIIIQKTF